MTEICVHNQLYCGDCLSILDLIPNSSIDLIYIDPPFYSQKSYEMVRGDEAERFAFEDRWKGGINTYLNDLMERIQKLYEKLKPTGLIFVHLDWHICHYVKVEMDKIFGYGRFLNEIIWYYKTGGMSKRWFGRKHDNILLYSKTGEYKFNQLKEKSYLAHKYGFSNIEIKEDEGGYYTEVGMRDVWDIPALRGNQPEVLGYPTQKPMALLERIITASTNPGDIVLDAYCGCGTTLAAAEKLGRRWIGIDISQSAIRIAEQRLQKLGANYENDLNLTRKAQQ
jgi:DNA modification methylase